MKRLPPIGSRRLGNATIPIDVAGIAREKMEAAASGATSAAAAAQQYLRDAETARAQAFEALAKSRELLEQAAAARGSTIADLDTRKVEILGKADDFLQGTLRLGRQVEETRVAIETDLQRRTRELGALTVEAMGHRDEAKKIAAGLVGIAHISLREQEDNQVVLILVLTDGRVLRANVRGPRGSGSSGPAGADGAPGPAGPAGAPGASLWGTITGLVSDQLDLQAALDLKQNLSEKGAANGYAPLGADSKVPNANLPALALTDVFVVASQAAQLALTVEEGDVAVRTDQNKSYIHNGGVSGTMADWQELLTPTDAVTSVDGRTGVVTLADLYATLAHASRHQDGGADEINVAGLSGLLADAQKVTVRKNAGADVGTRKRLNLIEGANITLAIADDAGGDEIDITINASGGSGTDEVLLVPIASKTIPTNTSIVVGDRYVLGPGVVLTIEDGANLTII